MKSPPKQYSIKPSGNLTRDELLKLADNLSKGKYEKESQQRNQILQMIAKELKPSPESPP